MNILLFGATSAVGSYLRVALESIGTVKSASRSSTGFDLLSRDDSDYRLLVANSDVTVCSASDFGGHRPDDIVRACEVNIVGLSRLVRASVEAGTSQFVLISTTSVNDPVTEASSGVYARSRHFIEQVAAMMCADTKTRLTIVRLSQVYDFAGLCARRQPFLFRLIEAAADVTSAPRIILQGSHDPLRNYVAVNDVVRVVNEVILRRTTGTVECAHGDSLRLSRVIESVFDLFNRDVEVSFSYEGTDLTDVLTGSAPNAFELLAIPPPMEFVAGLGMIKAHRESVQ